MDQVEEFARIRAEIVRLEERAALLREAFLKPGARLVSPRHEVVVRQVKRLSFQKELLPPEILNAPCYWRETPQVTVTVLSRDEAWSAPMDTPRPMA